MRKPETNQVACVDVGLIVPSSNTVVEPVTAAIAAVAGNIRTYHTRVRVTRIAGDPDSDLQFEGATMAAAATLLGDADVDVVAWAGTSGSWMGLDHDREFVRLASQVASAPATTSTIALLEACKEFGIARIGLVTPYTSDIVQRIQSVYMTEGVQVVAERHFSLSDNRMFAHVDPIELRSAVLEVAGVGADAIAIVCTNLAGSDLAGDLEGKTGLPIFDSVTATLWHAVKLTSGLLIAPRFGRLLGPEPKAKRKQDQGVR